MDNSTTYFFPTRHTLFCDLFRIGHRLNAIELYDLSMFVDDFVLNDSIYLNQDFLNILTDIFIERGVEDIGDILLPIESGFIEDYLKATQNNRYLIENDLIQLKNNKDILHKGIEKKSASKSMKLLEKQYELLKKETGLLHLQNVLRKLGQGIYLRNNEHDIFKLISSIEAKDTIAEYKRAFDLQLFALMYRTSLSPGIGYTSLFHDNRNKNKLFDLYKIVSNQLKADIEQLQSFFNIRYVYLPPFLSILLSRCSLNEDIPVELRRLREEFVEVRKIKSNYQWQITNAKSFGDAINISREYQAAQEALSKLISSRRKRKYIRCLWDIVKSASIKSMLTKTVDLLLDWDAERKSLNSVKSFNDIYGLVRGINEHDRLILKCFRKSQIDESSFDELEKVGNAFKNV